MKAGEEGVVKFTNNKLTKEAPENPSIEKEFDYKVSSVVPEDIDNLESLIITDNIKDVEGKYIAYINGDIELKIGQDNPVSIPASNIEWVENTIDGKVDGKELGKQKTGFVLKLKDKEIESLVDSKAGEVITIKYKAILTDASVSKVVKNKVVQFIPGSDPTETEKNVIGKKGKLILTKVDLENNEIKLSDAEFKLEKKVEDSWVELDTIARVSDNNGQIVWDNLGEGTYRVRETKAPTYEKEGKKEQYVVINELTEVTITEGDNHLTVENRKGKWYLPETGGTGYYIFTALSIGLLSIGFGIYTHKRKSETIS